MGQGFVIHTPEEIVKIREATRLTAVVRDGLVANTFAGMSTAQLNTIAGELIRSTGGKSAFLNYRGYPGNVCISVNEEIIHGIGRDDVIIRDGDIVSFDVGVAFNGGIGDSAITIAVGEVDSETKRLLEGTENALYAGINAAVSGNYVRDISMAIEKVAKNKKLSIVKDFVGHGVGTKLHEPPEIPNFVRPSKGAKLVAGMVLAIEPMFNLGSDKVVVDRVDRWTVRTFDGKRSAHFEHTILITNKEPEILTWQKMM